MPRRRLLELAAVVAAAVAYFAFVPQGWYTDHVPFWLAFGVVVAVVWQALD